ncbi:MAG: CDP-alcohol phosphatidyltransferase family protein [Hydrogenobacter thermophilus]|uniref:CDP-alcohol phosphatidyltransferase family protein n=1 Tax=Hydrogenobacter thermophilus TaxID=940 RepID=UPI0030F99114|nr:CDP-alcohol phosphatidyltransferase family protein [Hydrogenobacter thermophilus]
MATLITLLRFLITFPAFYAVISGQLRWALVLILLGALSDLLDGSVARKNKEESKWGALLDPLVDKIFFLSILSAFLYMQQINPVAFLLLLIRELLVSFLRSMGAEKGYTMQASYLGKTKTFFEFLSLILLSAGSPLGGWMLWIAVLFAYISMYDYLIKYTTFEKSS